MSRKISVSLIDQLTKSTIGLANVDNTSDANKPISSATQTALNLKAGLTSPAFTGTVTVDGSQIETRASRGIANGYAALGPDGKVPTINLPDNGSYKGNWDASTNTPTIVAGIGTNGDTYTVSVAGTQSVTGSSITFAVGDQIRFTTNGNKWERIPNSQTVSSVAGLVGTIPSVDLKAALSLVKGDVGLANVDNTSDINKPISTAVQTGLAGKQPLSTRLTALASSEAEGRATLSLPYSVPNNTAAATLKTVLSTEKDVVFARNSVVTISSLTDRLIQMAGGKLDLNNSKISFDYTDETNTTSFEAQNVSNGIIEIATTRVIQRLVRFANAGGRLRNVTIRAADPIINSNDTNDALIKISGDDFVAEDVVLENSWVGFLVEAKNATFRGFTARGMNKGIAGNGGSATISGFNWFGAHPDTESSPGMNAISGWWRRLRVDGFYVGPSDDLTTSPRGTGEHGIYVAGPGKELESEVRFVNGRIRRAGQCGFKAKDYSHVHVSKVDVSWTNYGSSPGLNEEGFRFQRNGIVTGGGLNVMKDLADGVLLGTAGYTHMFFSGCDNVILLDESYAEGSDVGGLNFGVDDRDATIPHGSYIVRVRHKNIGGPSVIIADNAIINGPITVFVDLDGCVGSPVSIGSNVTWGASGKLTVIGKYKNNTAPLPASTDQIDFSLFRPDNRSVSWGILKPETQRLLDAFLIAPRRAVTFAIDDAIEKMMASGVWTDLSAIYWLAAESSGNSIINWKSPGNNTLISSTNPVFTAGRGWNGNSVGYLTSDIPWTNFPQDNVGFGVWATTNVQDAAPCFGTSSSAGTSNRSRIIVRNTSDQLSARLSASADTTISNTDGRGHYSVNRLSSTNQSIYKDGTLLVSGAVTSTGVPTGNVRILANGTTIGNTTIGLAYVGTNLDATKIASIDSAFRPLMTLVGALA